jgi:hypothetical protein
MSEMNQNKTDISGRLQGLRREFALRAEGAGTIEAIAGGPVDRDLPPDYWGFTDEDLENELWNRLLELDRAPLDPAQAMDIPPGSLSPAKHGLSGKIKGGFKNLLLQLAKPLVRITLARQGNLNRQLEHLQFIQFLAVKQLRQRLQRLERENRDLRFRLAELEIENAPDGETSGHE